MMEPLVSIAVIAYKSAETILETLESIKAQTYPNIELIISDDCSPDNTVELCREWIKQNGERFVRTEVITIEKNKGVSANFNRADNACVGEWVKPIAGDDVLLPNCIQDCVEYVSKVPNTVWLFGRCQTFGVSKEDCKRIDKLFDYSFFSLPQHEQLHKLLVEGNCIPAPAAFYHKERVRLLGVRNDERIPNIEDWPKWINLLKAGVHFEFLDKVIVKYRISETSLSTARVWSNTFNYSNAIFYKLYLFQYEYDNGNKKRAIENWLRAQYTIHKGPLWYIIFKAYKMLVMHKLH